MRATGLPFWSWNDELEIEKLIQQIREMHKNGYGGFFMHARSGLKTDYLKEKWFTIFYNIRKYQFVKLQNKGEESMPPKRFLFTVSFCFKSIRLYHQLIFV